jgi:Transposase
MRSTRCRRPATGNGIASRAESDAADAHTLADMVRTDSHQLRPVAADTPQAEAVNVVTRAHKTLIWERTRHTQRLRHALREYFPAALEAFEDLDAADVLESLARAPDPASAARLTIAQISAALARGRRRNIPEKAARIQAVLRAEHLGQPAAYAATPPVPPSRCCGLLMSRSKSCRSRSMRILVSIRMLRSSAPSLVWDRFLVPGCSPSSGMSPTATPTRKPGKTMPVPARSPEPPAKRRS